MFPVFEELLKPQVYNRDPPGMEEAELESFNNGLKNLPAVSREGGQEPEAVQLFLKVLDLLERFMLNSRRDQLVSRRFHI